jgi:hypothetical protein
MQRTPVNSSNIKSIGYDVATSTLEVEFTSGDIYHYFNVPSFLYQQFLHSTSHGQFLSDHIRFNYRYQKVR